jgi:hypothetical protein
MQVCAAPGTFARWVDQRSVGSPNDPNQLPLGQDGAAAHAGSLRHMLHGRG